MLVLSCVCDKGGAMEVSCVMNKMGQVGLSDEGMGAQQIVYRCSEVRPQANVVLTEG